ncbi:attacin-like [Battus philenor]|uniref:attacin-like n=1 Tax=Battus philenor TaxID=42288 RepID=UPI0035D0CE0B
MILPKIIVFAVLIISVSCRHLTENLHPYLVVEDNDSIRVYKLEEEFPEESHLFNEGSATRVRRQAHGNINSNPDGTTNFAAKIPITGGDKNMLSAVGTVNAANGKGGYGAAGGGLAWDNVKGHGASLTGQHIPGLGNQMTAAGKMNLFHNDKHDVTASAFGTRTFPDKPNFPTFDTYGGNVGYTYDNKVGASLGMAHTDVFKKTDYSMMGNMNLFKDRSSSLDFNAGMHKSVSPYMPTSRWEPTAGLSFTRWF